ncbi:enduracididine biosynthesis enzyme MppR [Saccharothrix sp. ALI-22-I]|uniref:enduracididine biosynthesis enzyme MppR n=1 Tax=Saccharothrix sp. ALI-22-I TaxID=1933778 RepID=UPI00097C9865|nr:enduracididine biosynthesis enzyme MppR [Saccharothrix sp. ALI-22-I]ONI88807.1 enduracididine biosynthesis enzyme MppR [Saccharothrix sp. ALI-22-I]
MNHTVPPSAGLRGYSMPFSPNGRSSTLTPPPWHFSGEVIMVDYRIPPEVAARFLPAGLRLGEDAGAAAAVFAHWNWCSADGAELANPRHCQFGEFLILLSCQNEGRQYARCPYSWVDKAVPLVRGWVQGMPKQFGEIDQTRPKLVGRAGPRPDGTGRFDGTLSVGGRRVAEATVYPREITTERPVLHDVPLVHTRAMPPWLDTDVPDGRLVTTNVTDVEFSEIWTGEAELRMFDALDADFAELLPVEVGAGYVFQYAETLTGGTLFEPGQDGPSR